MPGVPRSRGCKSCLKQKKKCDQAKPACSRCARLGVPCVGSGEQKYVFKPVSFTKPFKTSFSKPRKSETSSQVSIVHKPQNPLTLLQAKLVAALEITDLRYGINCYGDFLEHIPRRLGHSHVLDVSVDLMMSLLPCHYEYETPSKVLAKFGSGLKILMEPHNQKGAQLSLEGVAAFHIMTICQSWLRQAGDDLKSHGQILVRFMDTATEKGWSGTFELKLLETSLVALFFDALVDPRIDLEQHASRLSLQSRKNEYDGSEDPQALCSQVQRLLRIPRFMHEPLCYMEEIKIAYQELQDDHARILHHLESVRIQKSSSEDLHCRQKLIHKVQVTQAIILTTALALNSILRAAYPDDSVLLLEASTLANKLITVVNAVSQYRPLGASFVPPCMIAAWATMSSLEAQRNEIRVLLTEYQHDYARVQWMDLAVLLEVLHGTLLGRISGSHDRDKVEKSENDRDLEILKLLVFKPD
ncbi:fungal transcriptional regulatory n-terminal [Fusarium denticulatum]|uniref:Fungal transcriptional regulatory n-terminal n=1 Tax=Fusarium denticulatum TaxID=48507 RepID=A0A8H5T9P9_9HYPO|nr:fungal transcriptional regulatory n-terminal [Fusarium denticulatum]